MRIFHINNVASVASTLAEEQTKLGHSVSLEVLTSPAANRSMGIKLILSPLRIISAIKLRHRIHAENTDIVHVHYMSSALWFIGIKAKLVVHAHGTDVRSDNKISINFWVNKLVCKFADLVFYSTPDLEPYIKQFTENGYFIPNPINVSRFSPEYRKPTGKILLLSALTKIKGADISLSALKVIQDQYPNITISTIKSGSLMATAKAYGFEMIDPVSRQNIANLINNHDIVIGQFKLGAFGVSELEAMACAKPVICYFIYPKFYSAPPPILNAHKSEDIVNQIEKCLNNSDRLILIGKSSREWVLKFHTVSIIVSQINGHYSQMFSK